MTSQRQANRGPAAAAENRAALIAAARDLLATRGAEVPLEVIAQQAGVGKGSLYRHFPTRESIILAVFEDNLAELEHRAGLPGTTVEDLLDAVVDQLVESAAFVVVLDPRDSSDPRIAAAGATLRELFVAKLADPAARGRFRADLDIRELVVAVGMIAGLLARTPAEERRPVAREAWKVLLRGIERSH
ncbi:TetR/AcrR family transcriptional regulator [Nocardia sp. CA-290969]|uniref:TetR/AcrR family transcriptional regulator n=1 Tax=Nocardia sp. CA-290969 TaxID=3239986 RepID=UPI003D9224F2